MTEVFLIWDDAAGEYLSDEEAHQSAPMIFRSERAATRYVERHCEEHDQDPDDFTVEEHAILDGMGEPIEPDEEGFDDAGLDTTPYDDDEEGD